MIKVRRVLSAFESSNCYLVTETASGLHLIVDVGEFSSGIEKELRDAGVEKLDYILLTHGHYDHIMGVKAMKETFGGKVVIHEQDNAYLGNGMLSLAYLRGYDSEDYPEADIIVNDETVLPFGNEEIRVIHTPGHTPGSVCYEIGEILFSGDTLFKNCVGRADLPGGNAKTLIKSLLKLKGLNSDYTVYPGHEGETTLRGEKQNNPYMNLKFSID